MEHLANIIDSMAWPITILIIIYMLKQPIFELIPYIDKFKYKDIEIEFKNKLNELSKKSKNNTKINQNNPDIGQLDYYDQEIERLSPRSAIMESWLSLENTALSTIYHYKLTNSTKPIHIHQITEILKNKNILDSEDINIIKELKKLRNKAVHEINFNISNKEAKQFLEISRNQEDTILSNAWGKFGGCSH